MSVAVLAAISAQTGSLAWLEAWGCRTLRPTEAHLRHIDARLALIGARFVALDAKRNGGGHVAIDHPRLIGMRE